MEREPVWSIKDRRRFALWSLVLFLVGIVAWVYRYEFSSAFSIMEDLTKVALFSITMSFFILEVWDYMLGIYADAMRRHRERGGT